MGLEIRIRLEHRGLQMTDPRVPGRDAQARAISARMREELRALAAEWRHCAASVNDPRSPSIYVDCAEDLERWLGL